MSAITTSTRSRSSSAMPSSGDVAVSGRISCNDSSSDNASRTASWSSMISTVRMCFSSWLASGRRPAGGRHVSKRHHPLADGGGGGGGGGGRGGDGGGGGVGGLGGMNRM